MSKYKNKFFDKIDYKNSCTENLLYKMKGDKREKKWRKQRKKYGGFDTRCGWNLNVFMTEHIYTWLKMYMKDADGYVVLTNYKFQINGKEMTERDAILEAISDFEFAMKNYGSVDRETDEEALRRIANAYMILGIIYPTLWW